MDLQDVEAAAGPLAARFGIRPPTVTSGRVPKSIKRGVRAKVWWGSRLGLVIDPAAERLEQDVLKGELASMMAAFTLRWTFITRFVLALGAALICEFAIMTLLADTPAWAQDLIFYAGTAIWVGLFIVLYRDLIYRSDRKAVEVVGAGPLLAVLEAERQHPSNSWFYLWALPSADRRAERITPPVIPSTTDAP
ncbi:hypothetical protein E1200_16035 [Actinomadura sp. GC306]|uniref:hypothetical protein n=1 Tax=Actinomadura sp. GC306 TaxID=2530367 RepID=UPI001049C4CD|nr:hypothetical protein [Actinomadura sp. GC306]TDC66865.1 hypothetical protein E1200_16035 [Actinomadura sp. GC306]